MKIDAVTGREVPDNNAILPLKTYINPRPAAWPQADFIVGNPPFMGKGERMRAALGDAYVETLRETYPDVPNSPDFVMYWWHKAANETLAGHTRRFGFITTNSISQTLNRRVVKSALEKGIFLTFAIPDHPWIDATECAAVRIAMTVGATATASSVSKLHSVTKEIANEDTGENDVQLNLVLGTLSDDLTVGASVSAAAILRSNSELSFNGVMLAGSGFILSEIESTRAPASEKRYLRHLVNGRDLLDPSLKRMVIDFTGLGQVEARENAPTLFNHLVSHVKPERDQSKDRQFRERWWLFGRTRPDMRTMISALPRFIVTVETAKHRVFAFAPKTTLPEHKLVVIGLSDAFDLGVLSSQIHVVFALAAGSTLEDRPVYPSSLCFQKFPFPSCTMKQKEKIRALAEELDAHRKRVQAKHGLGLTDIYNVLEKVREGIPINAKEKIIHDAALVSTLEQHHDDLDAAVADAYGWPWPLTDAEILERVVALNTARAAEEAKGTIRWLRPDYQIPLFSSTKQSALDLTETDELSAKTGRGKQPKFSATKKPAAKKIAWPKPLADRVRAVETALAAEEKPAAAADLAKRFTRANADDIAEILDTLVTLGRARPGDTKGTFVR